MVIKKWRAENTLTWKYAICTVRLTRQPAKKRRKQTLLYPVNILLKSKKMKIKNMFLVKNW